MVEQMLMNQKYFFPFRILKMLMIQLAGKLLPGQLEQTQCQILIAERQVFSLEVKEL